MSPERVADIAAGRGYPSINQARQAGGTHPTYLLTENEAKELARDLLDARKERDALKAMVAEAWEEGWWFEGDGWRSKMMTRLEEELARRLTPSEVK